MSKLGRSGRQAPASPVAPATIPPQAAIEPAVDAAADRAAVERTLDPVDGVSEATPVAVDPVPSVVAEAIVASDAAVLPEPTLVAEPGAPLPIVTASPILAIEPSAVDVVKAKEAAVERAAGLVDPLLGEPDPSLAAAGQPTLTIERGTVPQVAHEDNSILWTPPEEGLPHEGGDPSPADALVDYLRFAGAEELTLATDDLLSAFRVIMRRDPEAFWRIRDEVLGHDVSTSTDRPSPQAAATVSVIEVIGPPQGRRRAGMMFGPEPRRFLASALDADDLAALRSDPLLALGISEVDEDAAFELLR